MEPKRSPKQSKIEAKIQHEKWPLWGPSWSGLGLGLGRFLTKPMKNHLSFNPFVNIMFLKKMELEKASWMEVGPIWGPKRIQNVSQIGLQMEPKWDRKTIKK